MPTSRKWVLRGYLHQATPKRWRVYLGLRVYVEGREVYFCHYFSLDLRQTALVSELALNCVRSRGLMLLARAVVVEGSEASVFKWLVVLVANKPLVERLTSLLEICLGHNLKSLIYCALKLRIVETYFAVVEISAGVWCKPAGCKSCVSWIVSERRLEFCLGWNAVVLNIMLELPQTALPLDSKILPWLDRHLQEVLVLFDLDGIIDSLQNASVSFEVLLEINPGCGSVRWHVQLLACLLDMPLVQAPEILVFLVVLKVEG